MPKAVRYDEFGGIDVLRVDEVERPVPGDGQVLVRVKAAGINPSEAVIRTGALADLFPSTFPSGQGSDLAGVIEEAGAGVAGFSPGDEVIGFSQRRASQAELVLVEAGDLTRKPEKVSWEVAGSLYVVGVTAWGAVHAVRPEEGETVAGSGGNGDSYREILRRAGLPGLEATATWGPGDTDERISSYGYGAVFAEVSVDPLLGLVRIRRMFAAYDVGRVVSPKLAHSQAIGGMVGGIGMALLEGTVTDHRDGRIVNAVLADYLVPVNADVPELDAAFIDTEDPWRIPSGSRGWGRSPSWASRPPSGTRCSTPPANV